MRQQKIKKMDPIVVIFVFVVYNAAVNVDFFTSALTLSPATVDEWERTDVTLTCSGDGTQLTDVKWFYNDIDGGFEAVEAVVSLVSGACSKYNNFLTDNPNLYSYTCNDREFTLTLKNISRHNHGDTWKCRIIVNNTRFESALVTIQVKVPVTASTIRPNNNTFTGKENGTLSLRCETSACRPQPEIRWYKDNYLEADGDEILLSRITDVVANPNIQPYTNSYSLNLNRVLNGWYIFCASSNQNLSPILSNKILVNVTYPPDEAPRISNISATGEYNVLQNDLVSLECSVTGGNPLPRLEWNIYNTLSTIFNGNTVVTKTTTWQATGRDPVQLICQSFHMHGNDNAYVTINILYPPNAPEITIKSFAGPYLKVNGTINVVEGRPYVLNCSSKSNPAVSLIKWNDLSTNDSSFHFTKADRQKETFSCFVSNVMRTSDSRSPLPGNNISHLDVNVLYPPKLNILSDKTIIEGDDIVYLCNFTPGNPSATNITWSWMGNKKYGQQLQLNNVSRNQAGVYTCNVQNAMVSSDELKTFGNDSGEFKLSVQYKTKVLRYAVNGHTQTNNFTVNENDAVNLTCEIEGNPFPTGELLHQRVSFDPNQQNFALSRNSTFQTSNTLYLASAFMATCSDTGVQTCRGNNKFYNESESKSSKSVSLFVMCKPRKSPFIAIPDTVASPTSVDVTLSFTALAYPVPSASGFVWTRKIGTSDSWTTITANGSKTSISTLRLQSNLTIKDVQQLDYGFYNLLVVNDVGQFNHTFNLKPMAYTNGGIPSHSSSTSAIAAGAAAGGLAILVAVIIIAVVYKKRVRNNKQHESNQLINYDISKDGYMELNVCEQPNAISKDHEQSPAVPGREPTRKDTHGLQELDDFDENTQSDYGVYGNAYEMIKRIERIDVVELYPYIIDKTAEFFAADYAKLPQGLTKSYEFSQKPENIALNRYHGIYPYDHSRVKISSIPEYFINACYIDGYKRKKAYIASLGPLSKTSNRFVMFWQMVWSEKSDVIVMLTKLTEPSGVKCDQYWPKDGTSVVYGEITVTSTGEEVYSDYVSRTFSILKGGQKRKLTHFHFMAWPDKSVPDDASCLLEFRRRVRGNHKSGPMIVHCSAGIGRTGTLIAIDILIEEGQGKGSVNVLECVKKMREQRTNMVQTIDQYYYIFKALVNALVFDNEAIPAEKIHKYVESSKHDRFSDMFQKFNQSVESDNTKESSSRNANKIMVEKNRVGSDIPGDAHRVRLVLNRGIQTSDYINAVYLNSFTVADHFIVAQSPLLNGVEDFLCLIYQEKCCCVVSMDGNLARQAVGSYLPPDNSSFTLGSFNVHCSRLDTKENYIVRKLKIEITGQLKGAETVVYHFQFLGWLDGNTAPNDPRQFVEFTEDVERFADQFGSEESHVLVHCLNAFERSCLFCAVLTLNEKIKLEKEVCIPNTLRQIRTRRKLAIPTLEQFKFCYQAADAYVSKEKAEANNAENSYMNVTMT